MHGGPSVARAAPADVRHCQHVTEKSAVPEWFGRAEAPAPAVNRASSGCVLPVVLLALAAAAASAVFGMVEHQRAERLERQLGEAMALSKNPRSAPAEPAPLPASPPPTPTPAPPPATAATPEPSADPTEALSSAEIMKVMSRARPALKACYDASPPDDRGAGRVTLNVTIAATGSVTQVRAERAGTLEPAVATCVTRVVRSLKFPESSGPTTVNYPVVFQSE